MPLNQAKKKRRNASLSVQDCKRDLSQLRIEKKESKPFYGDFPLPPPLPCGDFWQRTNRQSILSLQLLSIFRDKRKKSAGEELELVLPCFRDGVCLQTLQHLKPFFNGGGKKKRHFIEHVGGHEGSCKRKYFQKGVVVIGALLEMVKPHQCFC